MTVKEIPFENLTVGFLAEFQQDGGKGIIDGDKKVLQIISQKVVDALEANSEESLYFPFGLTLLYLSVVFQAILR